MRLRKDQLACVLVGGALSFGTPSRFLWAAEPNAGQNRTVNVNYVYSSSLGFGGYSLAGLTASVYELPLGYRLPAGPDGWMLKLSAPIQLGIYSFKATDTNGSTISLHQQSLALVPEAELQIPLGSHVVLKPFLSGGAGHAFGTSTAADAWIYSVGVRVVTSFYRGPYTFSVGNAVLYAGDSTIGPGFRESYAAIETGFDVQRPLGFTFKGIRPELGVYIAQYYYPKPLLFSRFLQSPLKVENQGEIGFWVGSATPLPISFLERARIGLGYVFGSGLSVYHVNFGFPF